MKTFLILFKAILMKIKGNNNNNNKTSTNKNSNKKIN